MIGEASGTIEYVLLEDVKASSIAVFEDNSESPFIATIPVDKDLTKGLVNMTVYGVTCNSDMMVRGGDNTAVWPILTDGVIRTLPRDGKEVEVGSKVFVGVNTGQMYAEPPIGTPSILVNNLTWLTNDLVLVEKFTPEKVVPLPDFSLPLINSIEEWRLNS